VIFPQTIGPAIPTDLIEQDLFVRGRLIDIRRRHERHFGVAFPMTRAVTQVEVHMTRKAGK
jgi:hypothetical protein